MRPAVLFAVAVYFEDAGKGAFMKNLGMGGSIQGEIALQVRTAIAAR